MVYKKSFSAVKIKSMAFTQRSLDIISNKLYLPLAIKVMFVPLT